LPFLLPFSGKQIQAGRQYTFLIGVNGSCLLLEVNSKIWKPRGLCQNLISFLTLLFTGTKMLDPEFSSFSLLRHNLRIPQITNKINRIIFYIFLRGKGFKLPEPAGK
jgi:hypothetical protein